MEHPFEKGLLLGRATRQPRAAPWKEKPIMPQESVQFLLTAEEAYPAFERMVLGARRHVSVSMRMFDPATRLFSDAGRRIGDTWADLIRHKLDEGVQITIVITDFDPVARPSLHRYSWACRAACVAAAEASQHPEKLDISVHMHAARVGWPHRLLFMPVTRGKLRVECDRLSGLERDECEACLDTMPGFRRLVRWRRERLSPRAWPPAPLVPATHHQKMAVVDGEMLYIGGLDLSPRRYDGKDHERPPEKTWHDVQMIMTGPVVQAAQQHLDEFREVTAGRSAPARFNGLLRTISADVPGGRRLAPQNILRELEEAYLRLIRTARHYIYIETQFLRSSAITDALLTAAEAQPELQLIVLMPAAPEDIAFDRSDNLDARFGEQLQSDAVTALYDAFGDRAFFGAPAQPRAQETGHRDSHYGAPIVYVHAKVMVVDGRAALVSSANLNGRSLRWDTETGVEVRDTYAVGRFFARCCEHWFAGRPHGDCERAESWTAVARENARLDPDARTHFILPYNVEPAEEFGTPIPGIPEEMV
jgi:phospholipase D1/2